MDGQLIDSVTGNGIEDQFVTIWGEGSGTFPQTVITGLDGLFTATGETIGKPATTEINFSYGQP